MARSPRLPPRAGRTSKPTKSSRPQRSPKVAHRPVAERIQCHVLSNTHWDREWKYSAQRIRHMLVYMLDLLLDIREREPDFPPFHLDSQTAPLLDYLEIRPEREELLREHIAAGRITVGPWFTLPDEFCIGGESIIRNLLLGHRIARRFGKVSKTGYSPFSWGQISQMPQVYQGFGIDVMMFYRGVNTLVAPKSEFIWEGPDGTRILASRLGARPRYNVWYVLQRPAYWGARLEALNDFEMKWSAGHGLFRLVDRAHGTLDYQLAHPRHDYHEEVLPSAAAQAIREQDRDWSTPHRLWSIGHDSSCPDRREMRMIADAQAALRGVADVFPSTLEAFQDGLRASRRDDWPVVTGEMRHAYTKGSSSSLLGWIISARSYLKQDNFRTEQQLTVLAEPSAVFAALLGAPYPRAFLDLAYQYLLQNHAHDSIGGCGRDVVHDDMQYRYRQVREIATCVLERALMDVAGTIAVPPADGPQQALVAYNPLPRTRGEVAAVAIDVPAEWQARDLEIVDERDRPVAIQVLGKTNPFYETVHSPNDVFNFTTATRWELLARLDGVPGMGYCTFRVRPKSGRRPGRPVTLRSGPQGMENEHLRVAIQANGTLDVYHKAGRRQYSGLGYFQDSGAAGNPWQHEAPAQDVVYTTLNERPEVTLVREGPLETAFRVRWAWRIPEGLAEGGARRSDRLVTLEVSNTVTLRAGEPWVEILTELDNVARDHYLRVSFPTGMSAKNIAVQTPFDVVERPFTPPDPATLDEPPQPEQPMHSFVDVSDGRCGLALLNDGLKAYEAHDDAARTVSLTLLRALAMRFFVPEKYDHAELARGTQCPGRQAFRYAIMPHAGGWARGGVWAAADRFNAPFVVAQLGSSRHGHGPQSRSFLEVAPETLHVSAVKQAEDGGGWVVRLFNPADKSVRARVRLNGGYAGPGVTQSPTQRVEAEFALPEGRGPKWRKVREVTLEELPVRDLTMRDGWVELAVGAKKIATVGFGE